MGTSNAGVTDDGSATISDEEDATTETDMTWIVNLRLRSEPVLSRKETRFLLIITVVFTKQRMAESVTEILHGLRYYFDKALPAMLLCKSERQQYQNTISDDASPSTVYGAEHLLRLFVKLPEILYFATLKK